MPVELDRVISLAARILVTETTNDARRTVAREAGVKRIAMSAVLDSRTTPLCQSLDGKVFDSDSPEAATYTPPFHVNCRTIWTIVGEAEIGPVDAFDPNDPELKKLVERWGHFITDPERYAPLRVRSGPSTRDFVFRRRRDSASGELVSELTWNRPRYAIEALAEETRHVGPGAQAA